MKKILIVILLVILFPVYVLALNLSGSPMFQALDSNGDPLSGGKLHTYEPGSSTNKATYTDSGGGAANANPVVLNSRGEAQIWFNGSYKLVLKDSDDVTIWTIDNFSGTGMYSDTTSGESGYITISAVSGTSEIRFVQTISGASITANSMNPNRLSGPVTTGVSSIGSDITGRIAIIDISNNTSGNSVVSGNSLYGAYIHNWGANSEVSAFFPTAVAGMSAIVDLIQDQSSGSTIWVEFTSGDVIANVTNFVCGTGSATSYYWLSGSTGESITLIGVAAGVWRVWENGSPSTNSVQ